MKGLHIDTAGRFLANKQAEAYSWGGAMGAKHPLDQWNRLISGGLQAQTGAEPPPLERENNLSPPEYSWIRPWKQDIFTIYYHGKVFKNPL